MNTVGFAYTDSFTITAPNGDQLYGRQIGSGVGAGLNIEVRGTINGGTGRFEGARGTWTGTITGVRVDGDDHWRART